MPRGPLPAAEKRRRNKPTVPTTTAEAVPRTPPPIPEWWTLGEHGRAWWQWAWTTPQASTWPPGCDDVVARRAALQDDLHVLDESAGVDFDFLIHEEESQALRTLKVLIQRLHGMAGGRLAVMKEMRELDNRLWLNPKAMLEGRIKIETPKLVVASATKATGTYGHLRSVPDAVEGAKP